MRGRKHRLCAVKVPACVLAHLPRGQAQRSGCLCSHCVLGLEALPCPCSSPAVSGSEQTPKEESGLTSGARFSLRCPVRVSPRHSPAYAGGASSPRNGSPCR